ncbi:hypothetical protein JW707_05000 [Candidatus Woesearchaeota archaeon]|nr:hypothetical protein [Candidatus Woesearchaeota archaeon]
MKIKFIFAIIGLMLIAACGGPATPKPVEVHVGTQGLEMSFMEQSPPGEVYLGEVFPVSIEMSNQGAYDIKGGILVLSTEEYLYVRSQEYQDGFENFDLAGKSLYDPIGGIDRKTIQVEAAKLDPQSETITTNIALTACYPYRTEATATVCVDPDIFGERQAQKACTPTTIGMGTRTQGGQELPAGQGAPIAITKIEQKMMPHENEELIIPTYMIYVKNMGNGLPVELGLYQNACKATGIASKAWNVVGLNAYLSDRSVQLDCTPKYEGSEESKTGYVKLERDEDYIRCTLAEGIPKSRGTYTTPLMIDMSYGYTFTISKQVLVRKQV